MRAFAHPAVADSSLARKYAGSIGTIKFGRSPVGSPGGVHILALLQRALTEEMQRMPQGPAAQVAA
jgi:hypothetical protein